MEKSTDMQSHTHETIIKINHFVLVQANEDDGELFILFDFQRKTRSAGK